MIAMIFEYWIDAEYKQDYVEHSTQLRKHLGEIDGFISIERFVSPADPEKNLVIGFFRDEEAVQGWRNRPEHRKAQALGRARYFTDYRLWMAEVVRDYSKDNRDQVPVDSKAVHKQVSD